jgi:hypothetical protein
MATSPLLAPSHAAPSRPAPALAPRDAGPERRAHYESWHLDLGDHGSAPGLRPIRAREHRVTWLPDGSGTVVVDTTGGPSTLSSYGAGGLPVVFPDAPPAATRAMHAYLRAGASVDDATDPVQIIDAVAELLNEWTLPARHQAAIVLLLARMDGITETGTAIDPLGRAGTAYLATSPNDPRFCAVLTVSEQGDRILAIETVYRGGIPELDIPAPTVVRSIAWH